MPPLSSTTAATLAIAPRAWVGQFLLLSAIWGSSFLFQHLAATEFGTIALSFMRVAFACLFLLPLATWYKLWPQMRQHWRAMLVLGILNSALPFACYAYAVQHITTGLTAILNAAVPLFGSLVAWFWLGDKPTFSRTIGLGLGFWGIVMLSLYKTGLAFDGSSWAMFAGLFASLCYAVAASWSKRFLNDIPPLAIATGSQISATLVLLIPGIIYWPEHAPSLSAWGSVLVVGVVCTGLAYILFFDLLRKIGPARTTPLTFVIPIFAFLLGVLFLGEPINPRVLMWGSVILLGTSLATGMWSISQLLRLPR